MSRTKAYIKGFTSTTVQKILTKIIGLIVTPIVLSYLGKDEYGIWIIIGSFLGYMGLMDFGITGSVTQLIAKSDNVEKVKKINSIVNNSFFLQVIIGLTIIVLGIVFSFFFPEWFEIHPDSKDTAWMAFLLATIGYGISFPPKTLKGLIRGKQQIALLVWLEFFLFVLTTALNLWMLHLGLGLLALPIGTIMVRLLSYAVFFKMAKRTFPALHLSIRYFKWQEAKGIFSVSSIWFIGAMSAVVIYSSDTIIIGSVIGTGVVTVYALTYRLSEFLREFIYTIGGTAMPGLGQLAGQGEINKIKNIFFTMFPLIMNITFAAVLFILLFNEAFVALWVGEELYGGNDLNTIFALTLLTTVVFHSFSVVLSSGLNLKAVAISRSLEAILNILISLWLVHDLGIIGVALGTVIASLMTSFWAVPYFASRYLQISFSDVIQRFGMSVGVSLVAYSLLYLLLYDLVQSDYGNVLTFILWCIFSLILTWLFGLSVQLKGKILERIR